MKRLVSVLYNEFYPFDALANISDFAVADDENFQLQKGDILIVWGGADIPPEFYSKGRSSKSGSRGVSKRDALEWAMMKQAAVKNIPIIGVCRGAQMLCALAGGHLIQHANNHSGHHEVITHDGHRFHTNSIHHQMMVPNNTEHEVWGWTPGRSNCYYDVDDNGKDVIHGHQDKDPEYIYFPKVRGFAIQWHPEMMRVNDDASQYVLNTINSHA